MVKKKLVNEDLVDKIIYQTGAVNNFDIQMKKIKCADKLAIWGTGFAGQAAGKYFIEQGIIPVCFVQSAPVEKGTKFLGIPLYSKKDFFQIYPDTMVILACNYAYQIDEELKTQSYKDYFYLDPSYLATRPSNIREILKASSYKINKVYSLLKDEMSRTVFESVLKHHLIYDLELMKGINDKNQYFNNDLITCAEGPFIDCGAYTGDTLLEFTKFMEGKEFTYYALEPLKNNYTQLKSLVDQKAWSNVIPLNIGAWSEKGRLRFMDGNAGDSRVSKDGTLEIEVDSIDNILGGRAAGFIKMDIEGAEMAALHGAKETIKNFKPTLAISAYHKIEDLWEIPLWILETNKEYGIYYRHHTWNLADTVCYGIPYLDGELRIIHLGDA